MKVYRKRTKSNFEHLERGEAILLKQFEDSTDFHGLGATGSKIAMAGGMPRSKGGRTASLIAAVAAEAADTDAETCHRWLRSRSR